jgi:cytochrome c peroxidase
MSYKQLYHEEGRIYEDLVTCCHRCHKLVHNLMNRVTAPNGRRGWKDARNIPKVSVFTLTGTVLLHKEIPNNEK